MIAYGPLHWELGGEILVWVIAIAVLYFGTADFRRSRLQNLGKRNGETYYSSLGYTLLLFNASITGLFLIGLVGMLLRIVSGFWSVWEMFYLVSIPMVFHVFPVLTLIAWGWSVVGWWRMNYSPRVVLLAMLLTLALACSAASYFALERVARQQAESMHGSDAP